MYARLAEREHYAREIARVTMEADEDKIKRLERLIAGINAPFAAAMTTAATTTTAGVAGTSALPVLTTPTLSAEQMAQIEKYEFEIVELGHKIRMTDYRMQSDIASIQPINGSFTFDAQLTQIFNQVSELAREALALKCSPPVFIELEREGMILKNVLPGAANMTAFAILWAAIDKHRRPADMYEYLRLSRRMSTRVKIGQDGNVSTDTYITAVNDCIQDDITLAAAPKAAKKLATVLECLDVNDPARLFLREYLRMDFMLVTEQEVEKLIDAIRRSDKHIKTKFDTRSTRAQLAAVAVGQPAAKGSAGTTSRDASRTTDSQPRGFKCYNCGEPGHIAKNCPKEKKVGGKQPGANTKLDAGKKSLVVDNSSAATSGATRLGAIFSLSATVPDGGALLAATTAATGRDRPKPRADYAYDVLIDSGSEKNIVPAALLVNCKKLDKPQTLVFGNGTQEIVKVSGELLLNLDEASAAESGGEPFVAVKAWASDLVVMPILSAGCLANAGVPITFSRDGHYADFRAVGGPLVRLDEQAKMKVWLARTASTALKSNPALVAAVAQPPGN